MSEKFVPIFKRNSKTMSLCVDVYLFNYVFTILFYNLSSSFIQLEDSMLPELPKFLGEKFLKVLCRPKNWSFRRWENFANTWVSKNLKGVMSGENSGWDSTSQSSFNNFCRAVKETRGLALSWWNTTPFLLANSGCFFWIDIFNLSSCEHYLCKFIDWSFGRISHTGFLSNPTRHRVRLFSNKDWFCG